jgi:uncharacterized repeat protein (TIGR03803 family)
MRSKRFPNVMFDTSLRPESAALAIMVMLLFLLFVLLFITLTAQPAQAQTYNVIYNFTGGLDGGQPYAGLTMDAAGSFYGTTINGGYWGGECDYLRGCGTVFKLFHKGSRWVLMPLYSFTGNTDGDRPSARVVFGPDGSLYGTTGYGGVGTCYDQQGCGTVFRLRPPASASACKTALCPWTKTVLYRFTGGTDGASPSGNLAFDQAGNLYGATWGGGPGGQYGSGVVFEITPSNGGWTESVLYNFRGGDDGQNPTGIVFDKAGNLYGTTSGSFTQPGTAYELTLSASGWTENILHHFDGYDGAGPTGLIFDQSGNLYGTTEAGGCCQGGVAFMLSPGTGGWTFNLLYNFTGGGSGWGFGGPSAKPVIDATGNLYGPTRYQGAYGAGNIFKLTPSGGGWTYTSIHDFTGGADGGQPFGDLIFGTNGNLYGTASGGGANGLGVVFEITP